MAKGFTGLEGPHERIIKLELGEVDDDWVLGSLKHRYDRELRVLYRLDRRLPTFASSERVHLDGHVYSQFTHAAYTCLRGLTSHTHHLANGWIDSWIDR